jgi:hypothetical protein
MEGSWARAGHSRVYVAEHGGRLSFSVSLICLPLWALITSTQRKNKFSKISTEL